MMFRNPQKSRSSREFEGPQRELRGPAWQFSHIEPGVAEELGEAA
jgi:hypothetical protein